MPEIGEFRILRNYQKHQWLPCSRCGKLRWVRLLYEKPRNLPCQACTARNRDKRKEQCCIICGREFKAQKCVVDIGRAKYCSKKCQGMGESGKRLRDKHPRWIGEDIKTICPICGKIRYIRPCRVNKGMGNFCSQRCEMVFQREHGYFSKRPNKPEKTTIALFKNNHLPFKYVGDSKVWLGNRNPDFINVDGKKQIIEIFGTYWHSIFDVAQRIEHYKQYGFSTLILWEDELTNPQNVLKKVRRFAKSPIPKSERGWV